MPTEAHRNRNKRYRQTQDQIVVTVPKGARDSIKKHAAQKNKSVNSFIVELIERDMGRAMNELAEAAKEETIK